MPDESTQTRENPSTHWRLWVALLLLALLLILGLIGVLLLHGGSAVAIKPSAAADHVIRVQAYIDGRSQLAISGNTVQWFHRDWAAPGKHGGGNRPTVINGQDWIPEWPDIGDNENRAKMVSNKYDQLDPPFPAAAVMATIKKIKARGAVKIVQQPKAANQFTLIVELDDNLDPGPADYIVEVHYPKQ